MFVCLIHVCFFFDLFIRVCFFFSFSQTDQKWMFKDFAPHVFHCIRGKKINTNMNELKINLNEHQTNTQK